MGSFLRKHSIVILLMILILVLIISTKYWVLESYYGIISVFFLILLLLNLFFNFEKKRHSPNVMVLIAVLSALAAVSRIPFAGIPSIQPTSALIILSAYVFGSEIGFMVGALAALVSNMALGQGPWTPWQMFAWGSMGYLIGSLRHFVWIKKRIPLSILGFFLGFVYGWVMNLWFLLGFTVPITWETFIAIYGASAYYDLLHGISNMILILILFGPWMTLLKRIQLKYDIQ